MINKEAYIDMFIKEFNIQNGVELLSADEVIAWIETLIDHVNRKEVQP